VIKTSLTQEGVSVFEGAY